MNKKLKITLYVLAGIVIFYHVLKFSGILVVYSVPTTGSEPNIKRGSFIIASNLITPKRGDFVTYRFNDPMLGESFMIHRLCGIENDTIHIVDGILYINGKNFDNGYNLKHSYVFSEEKFKSLGASIVGKDYFLIPDTNNEKMFLTFIEDKDARKLQLNGYRFLESKSKANPQIKETYQQDWNKDHFGPYIVPKGKVFVLGDNRDNSSDSRSYGPIDKEAIVGALWKTLFVIDAD
ncbi:MAG: signal peptidase I [Bacteroidota bacterium]